MKEEAECLCKACEEARRWRKWAEVRASPKSQDAAIVTGSQVQNLQGKIAASESEKKEVARALKRTEKTTRVEKEAAKQIAKKEKAIKHGEQKFTRGGPKTEEDSKRFARKRPRDLITSPSG